jgi:flagellar protein FliS
MANRGHVSVCSTYLEQEILSESPLARVARVYEMALQQVSVARSSLASGALARKGQAIGRAADCITLLQSSLNMSRGGEVSRNLDRIYSYLLRRIGEGHLRNDDSALGEVAEHLRELGSAWREVARRADAPAGAALAAAGAGP